MNDVGSTPPRRRRRRARHLTLRRGAEATLTRLGDVQLDEDRGSGRRRMWIVAPGALAAAAAVVGIMVVARPDQQAVVPARDGRRPGTDDRPSVVVPPTRSSRAVDHRWRVDHDLVDRGRNGSRARCDPRGVERELRRRRRRLPDAVDVHRQRQRLRQRGHDAVGVRTSAGPPPRRHRLWFFPSGGDGSGQRDLVAEASGCFAEADLPGALIEDAGCNSDGIGVLGALACFTGRSHELDDRRRPGRTASGSTCSPSPRISDPRAFLARAGIVGVVRRRRRPGQLVA